MYDICFCSSARDYGGAEIYVETLLTGCQNAGKKVFVVVNAKNSRLIQRLDELNVPNFKINKHPYSLKMYVEIFKLVKSNLDKKGVLHVNLPGPWNCHFYPLVGWLAGARSIVTTEHLPMFGPSVIHTPIKCIDDLFVNKVITVSYENTKYLKSVHKIAPSKIEVVHNGIDVSKYYPGGINRSELRSKIGLSNDDYVVGIVGRLTHQKGHKYAIEAMASIVNTCPKVKLVVMGDGELLDKCVSLVNAYELDDNVIFPGFQRNMDVMYKVLDCLLMPSIFEALPLSLLEAMSCGVPAIASNINGIPEVIDNDVEGLLIEPKSVDMIIKAVKQLYENRSLLESYSKRAREKIESEFSLEMMSSRTINLYDQIHV